MVNSRSFGSVEPLPSGRFRARYTLPGDPTRRTAPHTFPTRKAADAWLSGVYADILRGDYRDPAAGLVTLSDYAARFLLTRVDLAASTLTLYRRQVSRWIDATLSAPGIGTVRLGATPIAALDVAAVRDWFAAVTHVAAASAATRGTRARREHPARVWARQAGLTVAATGRLAPDVLAAWQAAGAPAPARRPTGDTGKTQAAQAYRVLRAICSAALDEGLIRENPCRLRKAGTTRPAERVPATPAEIAAIAEAMPPHLAAAVHVAAWSGIRAGELFALDRSRVNLTAGTVRIDRTLTEVADGRARFGPPKTESSVRTVHLPPHVTTILAAHMAAYTAADAAALIFTTPNGAPVYQSHRQRAFTRARDAAGRPDLRWHDLRHTGATLAAQTGASVREIQHRLGHATVSAAMIYQHHTADRDRTLAERLSALVTAPGT